MDIACSSEADGASDMDEVEEGNRTVALVRGDGGRFVRLNCKIFGDSRTPRRRKRSCSIDGGEAQAPSHDVRLDVSGRMYVKEEAMTVEERGDSDRTSSTSAGSIRTGKKFLISECGILRWKRSFLFKKRI